MEWYKIFAVCLLICLSREVEGASVLALFSSLSFSDHLVFRAYMSQLSQNGHSVVIMTPYPGHFTYPDVDKIVELDVGSESAPFWDEWRRLVTNVDDYYTRMRAQNELNIKIAIAQLRSKQMTALFINPNIKFDLVITEADVPVLYAVADKYKAAHISLTASTGKIYQHQAKGNPIHPLLYIDVNTINYGSLTYWQKFNEFYRYVQTQREYYGNFLPLCDVAAKKIFGNQRNIPELEEDIDLLVVAANPLLIGIRPSVPTTVYADRMHITPGLALPQGLQVALDKATKGVVYFSLGAVQDSEQLSLKMLKTLAAAFRELPYTVLWKIGNTTAVDMPDNVIAQPWFPQQQILAHPNVKAFITSGGSRSLEEAVFYQVPIVGLPIVKSRKVFIGEVTKHGAGEIIDPYYMEIDSIKATVSVVAGNEKYKKAMLKLKVIAFDGTVSGPELLLKWTEYVLRHGGARHLRAPAVGVTFLQYTMLGVFGYFIIVSFLGLWIAYVVLRFIVRRIRAKILGRNVNLGGKFKAL